MSSKSNFSATGAYDDSCVALQRYIYSMYYLYPIINTNLLSVYISG